MDKRGSAELLNVDPNHFKNASSDSLNSDSKSSSLNSKMGQESVNTNCIIIFIRYSYLVRKKVYIYIY